MSHLCAQGDILIELVEDADATGKLIRSVNGAMIVARGEATGHHHRLLGSVTMYRDDSLARDIPSDLYIGHVKVTCAGAELVHEEHAAIQLEKGTYRLRRQRQLEPADVGFHEQFSTVED